MLGKIHNCVFHLSIMLIILHVPLIKQVEGEQDMHY